MEEVKIVKSKTTKWFDCLSLLEGLESERPGIKDRVWEFMCRDKDIQFTPINGRLSNINLFYFGAGDEYDLKYLKDYPEELERCKEIFPESFIIGSVEYELRLDFNLIWYVYEKEIEDIGMFTVKTQW